MVCYEICSITFDYLTEAVFDLCIIYLPTSDLFRTNVFEV